MNAEVLFDGLLEEGEKRAHMCGNPSFSLADLGDRSVTLEDASKPDGLWYGIGGSWYRWCRSEMPAWVYRGGHAYEVVVDESKMLFLRTPEEILSFTDEYLSSCYDRSTWNIDWSRVAESYSGIEISPYQYSLRMSRKVCWYYPWDVASGVVWDNAAILDIVHVDAFDPDPELREYDDRRYN